LAGQSPQEPSWQPQEQDQGRQGWQSYSPPSAADSQETYAYPQSGAPAGTSPPGYGQGYAQDHAFTPPSPPTRQEPVFTQQDQAYRAADQAYADGDQAYAGAEQGTPQWQDQGSRQWQGQGARQWQARPRGAAKAADGTKGFVASLFDFGFTSFVTPKIIKALYVLVAIWTVIWALIFLRLGFKYGGVSGGLVTLIVVVPVFGLLMLGAYRVLLEFFMIVHRIHDELRALRERSDNRG
jgi:hypothetical protein